MHVIEQRLPAIALHGCSYSNSTTIFGQRWRRMHVDETRKQGSYNAHFKRRKVSKSPPRPIWDKRRQTKTNKEVWRVVKMTQTSCHLRSCRGTPNPCQGRAGVNCLENDKLRTTTAHLKVRIAQKILEAQTPKHRVRDPSADAGRKVRIIAIPYSISRAPPARALFNH